MRWLWLVLLLMCSAHAAGTEMWRWTDERGVVHYSDRPHPGAERVDIRPAQTFPAPPTPPAPARPAEPEREQAPVVSYSRLSILAPQEEEVLWNIGGELSVQLAVDPPLASGHELRIYLDGERVEDVPQGPAQFTISEVYRGERQLRASIVDERGRELASSPTVRFYVQQASLFSPARRSPGPGGG